MRHGPRSLVAVLILTALSLIALTLTGLMEWISAVLFLLMEFVAEFLRPLLKPKRRRPSLAAKAPPHGAIRRLNPRRRARGRRPSPCRHGRRPGVLSA